MTSCCFNSLFIGHLSEVNFLACRHARGRAGYFQADAARQASHDVFCHAVSGDSADLQEVHDRRMFLSWPASRSARTCREACPASPHASRPRVLMSGTSLLILQWQSAFMEQLLESEVASSRQKSSAAFDWLCGTTAAASS